MIMYHKLSRSHTQISVNVQVSSEVGERDRSRADVMASNPSTDMDRGLLLTTNMHNVYNQWKQASGKQ